MSRWPAGAAAPLSNATLNGSDCITLDVLLSRGQIRPRTVIVIERRSTPDTRAERTDLSVLCIAAARLPLTAAADDPWSQL